MRVLQVDYRDEFYSLRHFAPFPPEQNIQIQDLLHSRQVIDNQFLSGWDIPLPLTSIRSRYGITDAGLPVRLRRLRSALGDPSLPAGAPLRGYAARQDFC